MPIIWMRHGTSLGNVMMAAKHAAQNDHDPTLAHEVLDDLNDLTCIRTCPQDSELTRLGVAQALDAGHELGRRGLRPAAVMSSCLPRAIETAHCVLHRLGRGGEPVMVVPHVHELRNISLPHRAIAEFAERVGIPVDLDFYGDTHGGSGPDLNAFRQLFLSTIAPAFGNRGVIVVSHGNFMEAVTGGTTPRNTEAWRTDSGISRSRHVYMPTRVPRIEGARGVADILRHNMI